MFLTIKAVEDGNFAGGKNIVFGIDQEGVGLGKLSPKANAKDVAAVEEVEKAARRRRHHGHPDDRQVARTSPAGPLEGLSPTGRPSGCDSWRVHDPCSSPRRPMTAPIRYARSGDVNIAYQVTGDGPLDLVSFPGSFSHLEMTGSIPARSRLLSGSARSRA